MSEPDIVEIMADAAILTTAVGPAVVRRHIRAGLRALDAAGYVVAPKEPTDAMIDAAGRVPHRRSDDGDGPDSKEVYLAMIAAATTPEEQP